MIRDRVQNLVRSHFLKGELNVIQDLKNLHLTGNYIDFRT